MIGRALSRTNATGTGRGPSVKVLTTKTSTRPSVMFLFMMNTKLRTGQFENVIRHISFALIGDLQFQCSVGLNGKGDIAHCHTVSHGAE